MNSLSPVFLWIGVTFIWAYGQGLCAICQALPVWYTIPVIVKATMILLHVTLLYAVQMKVQKHHLCMACYITGVQWCLLLLVSYHVNYMADVLSYAVLSLVLLTAFTGLLYLCQCISARSGFRRALVYEGIMVVHRKMAVALLLVILCFLL